MGKPVDKAAPAGLRKSYPWELSTGVLLSFCLAAGGRIEGRVCVGDGYPFWGYCWILYRGMTVCPSSCLQPRYAHYLYRRFVRSDQISVTLSSVPAQIVFMASISFACAESVTTGAWTKDLPLLFRSCPACGCPSGESHLTECDKVVDRGDCSVVRSVC